MLRTGLFHPSRQPIFSLKLTFPNCKLLSDKWGTPLILDSGLERKYDTVVARQKCQRVVLIWKLYNE